MFIYLLTHSRELAKKSNTGKLVSAVLPQQSRVIVWQRTEPDTELLERIQKGKVALLYPGETSQVIEQADSYAYYILLDGTWQEAQKMYNKSSYLKCLPKVSLSLQQPSAFHLRRNQKAQGLCTAECAIALLKHQGCNQLADQLQVTFDVFLKNY